MSLLTAVEAVEAALERGELDAAIDAVVVAAEELADEDEPDQALAARLAWAAATISLARGDGEGFAARAIDAVELGGDVTPALGGDLAALAGYVAGWIGALGGDAGGPVRLETVVASGDLEALGPGRAAVVTGTADERAAVARTLGGFAGALVWLDGTSATATDARVAMVVAHRRAAVLVVDGGAGPWLDDVARSDLPLVVLAHDDDFGRALAVVRRARGEVVARSASVATPAIGGTVQTDPALELLVFDCWDGVPVRTRSGPGRCASLIGDVAAVHYLASATAARVGVPLVTIDVGARGLPGARDAVAADAGVVLLDGVSALTDPTGLAALAGMVRASRTLVLLGERRAAVVPRPLAAISAAVVAAGGGR